MHTLPASHKCQERPRTGRSRAWVLRDSLKVVYPESEGSAPHRSALSEHTLQIRCLVFCGQKDSRQQLQEQLCGPGRFTQ